jgi:thiamine transport system permease protein
MVRRMGKNSSKLIKKLNKRSKTYDVIYMGIWIIPFIFFAKDFFEKEVFLQIFNYRTFEIVFFSIKQSFISTSLAFVLGIIPAIYISKSKGIMANLINTSIFIPFFFPVISTVISFTVIFNSNILKNFGILYSLKGIILANVFYNVPIFVKYIGEALKNIDKSLVEAFRLESNSKIKLFFYLYIPLVKGAIKKAYFLTFSYCFTSLAIVLAIGGVKFTILESAIATTLKGTFDFSKAFAYGILQFIILLILNIIIHSEGESFDISPTIEYKKSSIFEKIYILIYLIFEYGVVCISLLFCFYDYFSDKFTLKYFLKLFTKEFNAKYPIMQALFNSSIIGIVSALLTIVIVYIFLKNKHKYSHLFILSSMGISGAFLGIALIYMNILYNISYSILLIFAYIILAVPIAYSFMYYHIVNFDKSIIEASYLDGASHFDRFRYIEFPILKNVFSSTFLQVFAIIFAEFSISYTMQIGDYFPTMSIINYSLSNSKFFLESSALSGFNTLAILILFSGSQLLQLKKKMN